VKTPNLYNRIQEIIEAARVGAARSVNTAQVASNWLIGREIVEEEQEGRVKAEYGARLLAELSNRLKREYGDGYSVDNLELFRRFYREYPALISGTASRKSRTRPISDTVCRKLTPNTKGCVPAGQSWKPGVLHQNLSWSLYRRLLGVEKPGIRAFYEIEAIKNNWSARELERQINSLLYERLALSRDKKGLMRLAAKGHEVQKPGDVFKDPVVMEFLGLPESPKLVETEVEAALIGNLQAFLLEITIAGSSGLSPSNSSSTSSSPSSKARWNSTCAGWKSTSKARAKLRPSASSCAQGRTARRWSCSSSTRAASAWRST
jgi:predicted nuclease of restriction endonuclease-like (RecB) superfamily